MLGVTPPISTDPPKPADIQASEGQFFVDEWTRRGPANGSSLNGRLGLAEPV